MIRFFEVWTGSQTTPVLRAAVPLGIVPEAYRRDPSKSVAWLREKMVMARRAGWRSSAEQARRFFALSRGFAMLADRIERLAYRWRTWFRDNYTDAKRRVTEDSPRIRPTAAYPAALPGETYQEWQSRRGEPSM